MKKNVVLCLLALIVALSLCACNSGGAQRGDNPVPDKAQSVINKAPSSVAPPSRDDSQNLKIVKGLLANKDIWSATDRMPEFGIAGYYATGYLFFDIDLDGNKELLVQLGGTDKLRCETMVYRFDGDGKPTELKKAQGLSFSVEDLTLWTDEEGNSFYLNNYTLTTSAGTREVWRKLIIKDEVLTEQNLFHVDYSKKIESEDTSSNASSGDMTNGMTAQYFIADGKKAVSKEKFDSEFNLFREKLTQGNVKITFIKSTDWMLYTDIQKENVLLSVLRSS